MLCIISQLCWVEIWNQKMKVEFMWNACSLQRGRLWQWCPCSSLSVVESDILWHTVWYTVWYTVVLCDIVWCSVVQCGARPCRSINREGNRPCRELLLPSHYQYIQVISSKHMYILKIFLERAIIVHATKIMTHRVTMETLPNPYDYTTWESIGNLCNVLD